VFDIPTILSGDALLDKAFGRAGKATATGVDRMTRARNLAIMRVRVAGQAISSSLASYVKGFPSLDRLPPFYRELVDVLLDRGKLKKHLGVIFDVVIWDFAGQYLENVSESVVQRASWRRCYLESQTPEGVNVAIFCNSRRRTSTVIIMEKYIWCSPSSHPRPIRWPMSIRGESWQAKVGNADIPGAKHKYVILRDTGEGIRNVRQSQLFHILLQIFFHERHRVNELDKQRQALITSPAYSHRLTISKARCHTQKL